MKHMKTVVKPAVESEVLDFITCDLCGEQIYGTSPGRRYSQVEVDEVTIEHEYGERYPEGGSMTVFSVDMCGECFVTKLTPWLESQGAKICTREYSY